ncbi:ABC transporter ATP-binding protein [Celeribacter neptunius]|uniref:Iron complex transport system ATP-binding protein n=1 Tax=Celeribacter neptunius TaxID=588602 RepID=A0A1I3TAT0_9RHOB|nr:ATP-binding cassette domain-containing protein [Celeribacter neptunius]SFJ68045.1 iron complex transport system ATP-binding protein [Celeribacter neptunius]
MIEICNVSHEIQGAKILSGIDLRLPKGGITALIGPNGAGKSTLLSLIARLEKLQGGTIRVDGADVSQTATAELARKLSILRQDTQVAARLTVADLVGFGRYPHHKGRPGPEDHAQVEQALATMALTGLRDRFLDALSGGQRQRAFVAMVLAQDTDYVLLDEPLNNLDMKHAREMMQQLRRAAHELGKSFVVVIHDINFAAAYADHIVALKDGAVQAQGRPDEIVTRASLREIFDLDIEVETVAGHPFALHQITPSSHR